MNSEERVLTTIEHEEPDVVPLTDHIYMQRSLEGILGEKGVRTNTPEKYIKAHQVLGLDLICAFPGRLAERRKQVRDAPSGVIIGKDASVNEWGIKQKDVGGMSWYLEGGIKTVEDVDRFVVPDPFCPRRVETVREIIRIVKGGRKISYRMYHRLETF